MCCVDAFIISGVGQVDIYLSQDDLLQNFLFAAIAGDGGLSALSYDQPPNSTANDQYINIFLIVYRRFARPYECVYA